MSASAHFSHITMAEYTEGNRGEISKWLAKDEDAHDWTDFFKYIARLEGDENKWQEVESRLRAHIKEVVPCDVLQSNPLAPLTPDPYDCVISSLCLESACTDMDQLKAAVKGLMDLLKPGGKMIISGITDCSSYGYNETQLYQCLKMKRGDLEAAIQEAGGDVLSWEGKNWEEVPKDFMDELFILLAEKKK